ncbi:hypothetical protein JTE90_015374 [Oedothorax gibbosus]|uniref:Uncharacterized protein n=1 Tax=Oedothorax gibbosus TaxID=931172 RepID=A0AAV6U421_9ARAC|nr:hypothetical protein JTE90_015374 [Oedothorax gibbosus]
MLNLKHFTQARFQKSKTMRFLYIIVLVIALASQCWSQTVTQRPGAQRLSQRVDQMICQTGCPILSATHKEGCCKRYHYNRCC